MHVLILSLAIWLHSGYYELLHCRCSSAVIVLLPHARSGHLSCCNYLGCGQWSWRIRSHTTKFERPYSCNYFLMRLRPGAFKIFISQMIIWDSMADYRAAATSLFCVFPSMWLHT
eukprot:4003608-Pleurochrysis_carterae.AAC.1